MSAGTAGEPIRLNAEVAVPGPDQMPSSNASINAGTAGVPIFTNACSALRQTAGFGFLSFSISDSIFSSWEPQAKINHPPAYDKTSLAFHDSFPFMESSTFCNGQEDG
jgi:hypothetical protein